MRRFRLERRLAPPRCPHRWAEPVQVARSAAACIDKPLRHASNEHMLLAPRLLAAGEPVPSVIATTND